MVCRPERRTSRSSKARFDRPRADSAAIRRRVRAEMGPENRNAANSMSLRRIYLAVSRPIVPRAPSLELSVLPNGGGQIPGLASCVPTDYDIDGAEGDRTPDLCIANAALSQLSYRPTRKTGAGLVRRKAAHDTAVGGFSQAGDDVQPRSIATSAS